MRVQSWDVEVASDEGDPGEQVAEATELRIELNTCSGIAMDKYLRIHGCVEIKDSEMTLYLMQRREM